MSNRFVLPAATVALIALCSAAPARASSIAYTVTNTTGVTLGNPPFTLGSEFTANSDLTITAVGIFDDGLNGLVDSYEVGVWDSGGNLLGSTTVPDGIAGTLVGSFRYTSISPVNLTAGDDYYIGAVYADSIDPILFPGAATGFSTDPAVTFVQNSYAIGGTLAFPDLTVDTEPAYFGPNFQFDATSVPEPTSVVLLGAGLAGLVIRRLRRS